MYSNSRLQNNNSNKNKQKYPKQTTKQSKTNPHKTKQTNQKPPNHQASLLRMHSLPIIYLFQVNYQNNLPEMQDLIVLQLSLSTIGITNAHLLYYWVE